MSVVFLTHRPAIPVMRVFHPGPSLHPPPSAADPTAGGRPASLPGLCGLSSLRAEETRTRSIGHLTVAVIGSLRGLAAAPLHCSLRGLAAAALRLLR